MEIKSLNFRASFVNFHPPLILVFKSQISSILLLGFSFNSLIKLKESGSGSPNSFFDLFLVASRIRSILLKILSICSISMFLGFILWMLLQFSNTFFVRANSGFAVSSLQDFAKTGILPSFNLDFLGTQIDGQGSFPQLRTLYPSFFPLRNSPSSQIIVDWNLVVLQLTSLFNFQVSWRVFCEDD